MKIIGVKPRFFRPVRSPPPSRQRPLTLSLQPFGGIDAASLKVLRARGYYSESPSSHFSGSS